MAAAAGHHPCRRGDTGRHTVVRRARLAALWRALALGAAGGLLAACHDPFVAALNHEIPPTFDANRSTATPHVDRWWTKFGSHELDHLMDDANVDNLDIAVAVAQLEQAEAQAGVAGAALWPTLNYTTNNQRSRSSGTNVPGIISPGIERNSFTRVLNASYVVDVWGQNRALLDAAVHTAKASEFQVEVVRLTTRAAVVNNFLLLAANRERVTVAEENLANAQRILQVIRERVGAGTASALDLAQQESLVAIQRAAIPALRQAAETSRTALALLIGRPPQGFRLQARSLRRLRLPQAVPGLPVALLVRRPDVRAAEQSLQSADANVFAARKAFFPVLTLTGQAGFQSALLSTLLRPESFIYTIAANAVQPIFQGGKLKAQLALSEAQRQGLLESYRKSIVSALVDVENALISIRENDLRERAQRVAVTKSRAAFNLSEQRLREGTIDLTTLLAVQNTLFQAEDALIQIRLTRLQAVVSLFQAIGGDWDEDVVLFPPE